MAIFLNKIFKSVYVIITYFLIGFFWTNARFIFLRQFSGMFCFYEIDPSLFLARARRRCFSGPWDHGGVSEGEVHKSLCSSKISVSGSFHSKTQPLKMHQNYDLCSLKDPRKINVQLTGFCFCFCFSCQKKGSKDFQALPVSDLKPEVH